MDWIEENQRLIAIEHNCLREPIPYISLAFFYINKSREVDSVVYESIQFSSPSDPRILSKERLLQLVQDHKKSNSNTTHFILKDICLFHIHTEPEQIAQFHEHSFSQFWTSYPILDSIILPPSIFIFNSLHTLYFFYYEEDKHSFKSLKSLKSSLKLSSSSTNDTHTHRTTKRVRWNNDDNIHILHKHTRKKYT